MVDVKRGINAGNLVLLRRRGELAEGRFDRAWVGFMAIRRGGSAHLAPPECNRVAVVPRPSTIGLLRPWEHQVPWFLASLAMPPDVGYGHTVTATGEPGDAFLYAQDGSWAEVASEPSDNGQHHVWLGGPSDLWSPVENALTAWRALGEPGWDRFGLTVRRDCQTV